MQDASTTPSGTAPRVLAIASGGGHWVQLLRMRPAWDGCRVTYVTTTDGFRRAVTEDAAARGQPAPGYRVVTEANRWQKLRLIRLVLELAAIVVTLRPDVVISTGAAPGYLAIRIARLFGARAIWVDSIANAGELSLSGQRIAPHVDLHLTQWPELARPGGPEFRGAVL